MTMVGAILIVVVFLPLFSVTLYKRATYVSGRFIYLIILSAFILVFLTLINLNLSKSVFKSVPFSNKYNNIEKEYIESQNNRIYKTLDGIMDEPSIWSKALSASEVSYLYNSGDGRAFTDDP